jgi:hypothetical protein
MKCPAGVLCLLVIVGVPAAAQTSPDRRLEVGAMALVTRDALLRDGPGAQVAVTPWYRAGATLVDVSIGATAFFPQGSDAVCTSAVCDTRRVRAVQTAGMHWRIGRRVSGTGSAAYVVGGVGGYAAQWRGDVAPSGAPQSVRGTDTGLATSIGLGLLLPAGPLGLHLEVQRQSFLSLLGRDLGATTIAVGMRLPTSR